MSKRLLVGIVICGALLATSSLLAHHSLAGVYDLIPAHQARDYVSAATAGHDPAELSVVANADHNSWTVPDHPAWSVARGHVLELVGL